ncbi:DUF1467 family protein [Notoacmeibacter sp. MSK16QG-6]|uniref:DUF1467 family protein n=1 Tax=Notoacmeibacter sp. MSK16QG-6 TaxID=2957982 RepID=UPI00209CCB5C|nr:DUF1467 family protein [Notoacmeibacter sp. MSK16QG-6]MCP1197924.1 DUF1467 family protein [Notoacmeibacter sp. MSK16QG-6]
MDWAFLLAVYFVLWWITLFAVLPFSMRTQDESEEGVTLGTTHSAPQMGRRHVLRAFLRTTVVSALLLGLYMLFSWASGWSMDDLPVLVPNL